MIYQAECIMLSQIKIYLNENDIRHLFFYIPTRFEIETDRLKPTIDKYYDLDIKDIDPDQLINKLRICQESNPMNLVSLKDLFLSEKEGMYNKYGNHWSPKATKLSAEKMAQEIRVMI